MNKLKNMDQTQLLLKVMEQKELLENCFELIGNVYINHSPANSKIERESEDLIVKLTEALK